MGNGVRIVEALEVKGYGVFLCVGIRGDGCVKVSGLQSLRNVSEQTYQDLREGIILSLDRMRHAPLDDLELR